MTLEYDIAIATVWDSRKVSKPKMNDKGKLSSFFSVYIVMKKRSRSMPLLPETHETSFFVTVSTTQHGNTAEVLLDSETWTQIANLMKFLGHRLGSSIHLYVNDINLETMSLFPCSTRPRIAKRTAL